MKRSVGHLSKTNDLYLDYKHVKGTVGHVQGCCEVLVSDMDMLPSYNGFEISKALTVV